MTTTARPMNRLVAAVMLATIGAIIVQIVPGDRPQWVGWVSLVLAGAAILLAALRTVPAAVRLGARTDSSRHQSELTESIGRDHVSAPPRSSPLSQSSCRSPDDPSPAHALPEQHGRPFRGRVGAPFDRAVAHARLRTRPGAVRWDVDCGHGFRTRKGACSPCSRERLDHGRFGDLGMSTAQRQSCAEGRTPALGR